MASCSVGIIVEGHHKLTSCTFRDTSSSQSYSSYNIVVIFMGGKDDREALALAKRISQHESVSLTVIHLKPKNSLGYILAENDRTLDDVILRDIKGSVNIRYLEEQVKDGTATSTYLRTVAEEYQLIIVGDDTSVKIPKPWGWRSGVNLKKLVSLETCFRLRILLATILC